MSTKRKPGLSINQIPHVATYLLLPVGVGGNGGLLDFVRWPFVFADEAVFGRRVVAVCQPIAQDKNIFIILKSTDSSDHVLRGKGGNLSKLP